MSFAYDQVVRNITHFSMISTLKDVSEKIEEQKKLGKKVGLITGCFDVLHFGHVKLFRFAKKHVDCVVVGLENDKTISLSKGSNRPFISLKHRFETLSELKSIDFVFAIKEVYCFSDKPKVDEIHTKLYKTIQPDYLITGIKADQDWQNKKKIAKHLLIKFLPDRGDRSNSSTSVISTLTK